MAWLDAGALKLNKQWYLLEEVIGTVLTRLQKRLAGRLVTVKLLPGIPIRVTSDSVNYLPNGQNIPFIYIGLALAC